MSRTAHKLMASGAKEEDYEIEQSIVLDNVDDAHLERTPSSAGNRRTWTQSFWMKLLSYGDNYMGIYGFPGGSAVSYYNGLPYFQSDGNLTYLDNYGAGGYGGFANGYVTFATNLRDRSAWYHIVVIFDTTESTASNRIKVFRNGVQCSAVTNTTYPPLNFQGTINSTVLHTINQTQDSYYGNMQLAEYHFIDGTARAASDFAETNATTGQWVPIEYTGGSYGTNGFYLPFKGTTSKYSMRLTSDQSGVHFGHDAAIDGLGTKSFTTEGWIYPENDGGGSYDCFWSCGTPQQIYWDYGNTRIVVYYQDGSSYIFDGVASTGNVKAGQWCHFAVVRNGNTMTIYTHGVGGTAASSSGSIAASSDNAYLGSYKGESAAQFNGNIYGVRHTIGTARYTSNFTPPTSDLTDDIAWNSSTGEGVGFLQTTNSNSTVTDSGNGVTVTKYGSWTADLSSPTTDYIGTDKSGQNNDLLLSNLDNSDVLLDTPTNNYPTINSLLPLDTTLVKLYQGNLRTYGGAQSGGNGQANSYCTFQMPSSGKWYIESYVGIGQGSAGGNNGAIGVIESTFVLPNTAASMFSQAGFTGLVFDTYTDTAKLYDGGSAVDTDTGLTGTVYVVALAIDVDNGKVYGGYGTTSITWMNSGDPAGDSNGMAHTFSTDTVIGVHLSVDGGSPANTADLRLNFGQNGTFNGGKTAGGNTDSAGEGNFFYSVPSGFKALCTKNLPTPTIKKSTDHFNTVLWTGNGSTQNITGVGFQPDWIWGKNRSDTNSHWVNDAVRGVDKRLIPSSHAAEDDPSTAILTAFGSDGFSLGSNTEGNKSSDNYVAWNWKANGSGGANTDGATNSVVSANTTSGFSIVTYSGTGSATTIGHGLGVVPAWIVVKNRTNNAGNTDAWANYHQANTAAPATDALFWDTTYATFDDVDIWNDTAPTSSVFTVNSWGGVNGSSDTYVAYVFAEVEGFSKFGSYTGNGAAEDGPFVFTGFKPRFVFQKKSSAAGSSWFMWDSARHPENVIDLAVWADAVNGDTSHAEYEIDFLSNGFKLRGNNAGSNASGQTHIYMAFAESPFKYANAR